MSSSSPIWVLFSPVAYPNKRGMVQFVHRLANTLATHGKCEKIIVLSRPDKNVTNKVKKRSKTNQKAIAKHYTQYIRVKKWSKNELEQFSKSLPDKPVRFLFPYAPSSFGSLFNQSILLFLKQRQEKGDEVSVLFYGTHSSRKQKTWLRRQIANSFFGRWVEANRLKSLLKIANRILLLSVSQYRDLDSILPPKTPVHSLPATSNLNIVANPQQAINLRRAFASDWPFVMGTYGSLKDPKTTQFLEKVVPKILSYRQDMLWIFIGRNSESFCQRIKKRFPELALRVQTAGELDETAISAHIQSCDLLFQPYPDGVSTTRTSMMACLHQGVPVITTEGPMTEQIWHDSQAVSLSPWENPDVCISKTLELCGSKAERSELASRGQMLYQNSFSADQQIRLLLEEPFPPASS